MIEMRWLQLSAPREGSIVLSGEIRILQFRQYAAVAGANGWSEWQDVPTVRL